mgnify:CR=1 FL=1
MTNQTNDRDLQVHAKIVDNDTNGWTERHVGKYLVKVICHDTERPNNDYPEFVSYEIFTNDIQDVDSLLSSYEYNGQKVINVITFEFGTSKLVLPFEQTYNKETN